MFKIALLLKETVYNNQSIDELIVRQALRKIVMILNWNENTLENFEEFRHFKLKESPQLLQSKTAFNVTSLKEKAKTIIYYWWTIICF